MPPKKPMKTTKAKTKKVMPTRGKAQPLPPREYFINGLPLQQKSYLPAGPFFRLPVEDRPTVTPAELASLVVSLGLPRTREGAGEALGLVWECAAVLADERAARASLANWSDHIVTRHAGLVDLIGFDPDLEKMPMTFARFMALMNKNCRSGIVVRGKKLKGVPLFRAFFLEFPHFEAGTERDPADLLERFKTEGFSGIAYVVILAREFAYWRDRVSRANMKRTEGNLSPGG